MSAAILVFVVGTSLLLVAWYGVLVGPTLVGLLAKRALLEERMLREACPVMRPIWLR